MPWDLCSGSALISSMLSLAVSLPAVDDMVLRRIRAGGSDPSTAPRTARDWRGRSSAVLRGGLGGWLRHVVTAELPAHNQQLLTPVKTNGDALQPPCKLRQKGT